MQAWTYFLFLRMNRSIVIRVDGGVEVYSIRVKSIERRVFRKRSASAVRSNVAVATHPEDVRNVRFFQMMRIRKESSSHAGNNRGDIVNDRIEDGYQKLNGGRISTIHQKEDTKKKKLFQFPEQLTSTFRAVSSNPPN